MIGPGSGFKRAHTADTTLFKITNDGSAPPLSIDRACYGNVTS